MTGLFFLLVVIVFVVAAYFSTYIWDELDDELISDLDDNNSIAVVNEMSDNISGTMNGAIIFLFIGFWLFLLVMSFLSTDYPIVFFVLMIIMVFLLLISMYLTNTYEDIFLDTELISLTETFSVPHWIMTHLLQMNLGVLLLSIIIAVGKNRYES